MSILSSSPGSKSVIVRETGKMLTEYFSPAWRLWVKLTSSSKTILTGCVKETV